MIEQEQKEMCFSNKHPFKLTPPDNDKIRCLHFLCLFQYWKIMGFFLAGTSEFRFIYWQYQHKGDIFSDYIVKNLDCIMIRLYFSTNC